MVFINLCIFAYQFTGITPINFKKMSILELALVVIVAYVAIKPFRTIVKLFLTPIKTK